MHALRCSMARGIFLDQGSNLSPALAGGFSTTEPPGKPRITLSSSAFPPAHTWEMMEASPGSKEMTTRTSELCIPRVFYLTREGTDPEDKLTSVTWQVVVLGTRAHPCSMHIRPPMPGAPLSPADHSALRVLVA